MELPETQDNSAQGTPGQEDKEEQRASITGGNATSGQELGQASIPPDALTPQQPPGGTTTVADLKLLQPVARTQIVPK